MKTEIRKLVETAETEDRGFNEREIAAVINSIPAEERMARTEILAAVNGPEGPTSPETRKAIAETLKYMEIRAADAREERATLDREAEVRALTERAGGLVMPLGNGFPDGSDEWRALMPSASEYREATSGSVGSAGGYTVPEQMAGKYVDLLTAESTFLRALPAENILNFTTDRLKVPQVTASSGGDYVDEGDVIPEGTMTWGSLEFPAKKIGRIQWASVEILEDSAIDLRNKIAKDLLRDASLKLDADAFIGSGTNPIRGIVSQGATTTLGAGKVTVTYDDLSDAAARIEAMNGRPSVIWASVDMAAALRKEKSAGSGTYVGGSPTEAPASTAWGLPILPTAFLPAKTVVIADASRILVGVRRAATLKISEDARFESDLIGFKLTMRVAGVSIAEPTSVQVVRAAAS